MYINPYTGMGKCACINIIQTPSKKIYEKYGMFEITDDIGRNWLCLKLGEPTLEPLAIILIYDSYLCSFATVMGDPISGGPLDRSESEKEKWTFWYRRVIMVGTPSVEELPTLLAAIPIDINGHQIYADNIQTYSNSTQTSPDNTQPAKNKSLKKIGSSALDPEQPEASTPEREQYEVPSFLNTLNSFLKRK